MRRPSIFRVTFNVTASTGLLLVVGLYGCTEPGSHREYVELGKETFEKYCVSCHGPQAKGDGPLAAELDKPAPDLTRLASRFDGVFPSEYVLRTIDGRQEFLSHGTRTMPIWGNIWRPGEEDTREAEVKTQQTLNGLLHYLESIQRTDSD